MLTSEDSKWLESHRRALADHAERLGAPVPTVQGRFLSIIDKLQAELKGKQQECSDRASTEDSLLEWNEQLDARVKELEAKLAESEKYGTEMRQRAMDNASVAIANEQRAERAESELKETQAKCAQWKLKYEELLNECNKGH